MRSLAARASTRRNKAMQSILLPALHLMLFLPAELKLSFDCNCGVDSADIAEAGGLDSKLLSLAIAEAGGLDSKLLSLVMLRVPLKVQGCPPRCPRVALC